MIVYRPHMNQKISGKRGTRNFIREFFSCNVSCHFIQSFHMKKFTRLFALVTTGFACVFLTGCASIISGRQQEVTFTSNPDGAVVTVSGRVIGKTPTTIQMDRRGGDQNATMEKDGYQTINFQLKAGINPWFFGNIIFGGLLGSSTDSSTGAIGEYSQDKYYYALIPNGASTLPANSELTAFIVENYKNIIEELNGKPDKYLTSLFTLMKVQPEQQADYIQKIKNLADENKDIVDFANKVAALSP